MGGLLLFFFFFFFFWGGGGGGGQRVCCPLSNYRGACPPAPPLPTLFYCIWFPPSQSAISCTLPRLLCMIHSRQEASFSGRLSWKELVQLYIICFRQTWCSYIHVYIMFQTELVQLYTIIICFRQKSETMRKTLHLKTNKEHSRNLAKNDNIPVKPPDLAL